jgi:Mg-chelatase subunit ChlD
MPEGGLYGSYESSVDVIDHIISQSPGGGYDGYGGGMGGMGGGYSSNGGDGSGIMRGYRDTRFGWGWGDGAVYSFPGGKGGNGVMSGDTLGVPGGTYAFDGDKDFGSKEINWFDISSDDPMVIGDVMAVGGRVEFQNGHSAVIKKDGLGLAIDNFEAYIDKDGDRSPVAIDAIKPVTSMKPELTPRTRRSIGLDIQLGTSTKPESASQSQPMRDVSGISNLPDIKLQTESAEPHVAAEDTKTHGWWAEMRAYDKEAVLGKTDDELVDMGYHYSPEKTKLAKPPVYASVRIMEGSRQDDVSREMDEVATEYSELRSRKESEKNIADFLESADETKSLPKKGQITITDCDFSDPAEGPADKKESDPLAAFPGASMREFGRSKMGLNLGYMSDRDLQDQGGLADKKERGRELIVENMPKLIVGDIPLVNRLFSNKRPMTEEEKRRIVAYLEARKSLPEGEPAELWYEAIKLKYADAREVQDSIKDGFREGDPAKVAIEALSQDQQIILYGRKEQREAVKKMVKAIDIPPGQSEVGFTDLPTEEAETDLPPSSRFKLVPANPWVMSERDPFSTFALDVDTASYALCRRYIRGGFLPPAGAVRMEEFVNYFNYQYPQRTNPTFKVHAEAAPSPFARKDQNLTLLKIGVKARTIGRDQRKAAHLIFVVDASASMGQPDRLPLVQQALGLLVNRLSEVDRVTLITCANQARLHMESIPARERDRIRQAIYAIQPAGSTNLLAGLKLGYATARRSFAPKQINHVVLCSDGVANVGQTEAEAVLGEVAADRKQGITITCVGVGYGSYNDAFMEALANRGDGSYMFLDSARQAHRVFVRQLAATLQTA